MEKDSAFLIFIALVVVMLGLSAWAGTVARKKVRARLSALAARLGFTFVPGTGWFGAPRITGMMRGKQVEVFTFTTGAGKSRKTWAAASARTATPVRLTWVISPRGFATKVRVFFGAKGIATGDPAFDGRWFVQTNNPEFLRAALLPELRAKIDAVSGGRAKGEFRLEGGVVRYAEQGGFGGERCDRYEALPPVLCDLADVAEVEAACK